MIDGVPDREGFVTGELAKLQPSPPFSDLTDFERKALDSIASLFGPDEGGFRLQVANARVLDRINTGHGFHTRIEVDRAACLPLPIGRRGGDFEVESIPAGIGVVLWDDHGYLSAIEGFTYGEGHDLVGVDLRNLSFVRRTSA